MKKWTSLLLAFVLLLSMSTGAMAQTYTASEQGFMGPVTVTMDVEDGKIVAVSVDAAGETPALGGAAAETLAKAMVEGNTTDVDAVTGSTITSNAVIAAAKKCLDEANGVVAEAAVFADGTYKGVAPGMNDNIEVEMVVEGGKVTSIVVTHEQETPGIGSPLKDNQGVTMVAGGLSPVDQIPADVVAHQTLNVDVVAGATITSNAVKASIRDALKNAGADLAQWEAEAPKAAAPADMSADVVVVGGGGAGLAAAVAAAQNGASVIVVEKLGEVGGDTLVCGAIYNAPAPEYQSKVVMGDPVKTTVEAALAEENVSEEHAALKAKVQEQWDAYKAEGRTDLFDTKEWYALQTWNGGDKVADLDLVKRMADLSYDGLTWLKDLGMEFRDSIGQGAGSLWQRTHTSIMQQGTGFLSTYVKHVQESDKITMVLSAKGIKLVKDETGRVTGVICEDKNGNTFTASATKGVVLATGGFGANAPMVQSYNTTGKWSDLTNVATTNRYDCSQGDGILMAAEIGANLVDMEQIQLLYFGNVVNGQITKYPQRNVSGTDQIIFINKEGKRFVNEGARRDVICLASFQQTDGMFYMLESGDGDQYIDIHSPDWRSADGFTFQYLEENGYVIAAETLPELAEKLGCKYEDLQATIDAFNESVKTGVDEYGRTLYSTTLVNGPWVATPRQACIHHTMGGVQIDTETHVLDTNGNIIPGLYAAGEMTGDIHGGNRLGGNAVVDTVVFGKLAGENAAAAK